MKSPIERIRSRCCVMQPKPTGIAPRLSSLSDISAVLFDIYGTLVVSGSGDIGSDLPEHRINSLSDVLKQFDLEMKCDPRRVNDKFLKTVCVEHERAKSAGVPYPEVDYVEIWSEVLAEFVSDMATLDVPAIALEFELRVNPTWPMPHIEMLIDGLRERGLVLGIVSNAQFFTPLLFEALVERSLEDLGFLPGLTYFSYKHRQAKPGTALYEQAQKKLADLDIAPNQVLYVGNDMLNDVTAASRVGFRTALFAGDQRSLRLRDGDDRVSGVEADIVVTELPQIIECLPQTNRTQ